MKIRYWYLNGPQDTGECIGGLDYHREDGPAIIMTNPPFNGGKTVNEWWYKGKYLNFISSQKEFERWLKLKAFT